MSFELAIVAAGYFVGAILHAALLRLVAKRPERRRGEGLLGALAASLLVWNAANFVTAFAELLTRRPLPALERGVDLVAVPALSLVPSLLLHTLSTIGRRERPLGGLALLGYAPLAPLALTFVLAPAAGPTALGAWLAVSLLGSAALAFDLSRAAGRRGGALPTTPSLYRFLAVTLLATAALAAVVVLIIGRRAGTDRFVLELLIVAGSTLPSIALAYAVYRYYTIRPLLRRGAIDLALALVALGVYLLGISMAGRSLERSHGWNVRAIEAVGIVALVFLFHPFRRRVLASLGWFFDPRGTKETAVLRALAADLARPEASRPAELAARVAAGVREALALEAAALAVAPQPGQAVPAASPPGWIDYGALLAACAREPAAMLAPADLPDPELARALLAARVERVRPLRYEEETVGALVLGRRADSTALSDEDLRAVEVIAGPLAAACTSVRLIERHLALERRLADAQRLAGLGRLSATVAHRVKNPLASIKAIAQALREDLAEDDPHRQDLGIIAGEVDALSRVVSQLLGFARGAPGGETGPVDIGPIAEDVTLLMQHQAAAAGVAVRLEVEPGLPPVLAEPSALREALANLVENAILASPPRGEVSVEIGRAGGGDSVRARVADQGPGVPPEVRPRLFEPFFTTRPGGTGLGLALSRQRVEAWGGRIYLEDEAGARGGGARFAFELPAAPETARAANVQCPVPGNE